MAHRHPAEGRHQRGGNGHTCRRSVLWNSAFREVDVDVLLLIEILVDAIAVAQAADTGDGSAGRFLHHISQRAGQLQLAGSFHHSDFRLQNLSADRGPRQSIDHTDQIFFFHVVVLIFLWTQQGFQHLLADIAALLFACHNHLRTLAAQGGDFTLQISHTCFTDIMVDDGIKGVVIKPAVSAAEPMAFDLLGNQIAFGNLEFFLAGIAGKLDNFHTVVQRRRNARRVVCRCKEEHIAQIHRDFQIMVAERKVLLGVQHLQQR